MPVGLLGSASDIRLRISWIASLPWIVIMVLGGCCIGYARSWGMTLATAAGTHLVAPDSPALSVILQSVQIGCSAIGWLIIAWGFWRICSILATSITLTDQGMFISHGIVIRRTDHLEWMRVRDMGIEAPIHLHLCGAGIIIIWSSDASHPVLRLPPLANAQTAVMAMRDLVVTWRNQHGVLVSV